MKVNINTLIKQIDKDEAIQAGDQCKLCGRVTDGEDLTLRKVSIRSLLNSSVTKPEEKLERYTLAQMIQAAPPTMDLDNDQIKMIKDDVAAAYNILIYGRVCDILDPTKMDKLRQKATPVAPTTGE
ncbi:hypothetical protein LCGC14_1535560 [marine sediment metagenome]|uniref:Uncharacterized protein n=1 Tax=marine sediment metagenome TaxID=412755 RepID=A0A0F9JFI0_9ZZZZ